jgi:hypothetical protein
MYKQIIYNSSELSSKHKFNKPKPNQQNNRYKEYTQTLFTAGDVDQFIDKLPIINNDIINTFNYIYHKFKKGIFVYIKNNKIHTFLPFSKKNFVNDWNHLLVHSNIKQIMNNLYRYDWEPSHWYANNCIIRNEFPTRENDSGISQIYHMLQQTCKNSKVNDSYFFINKRDFPLIKKDRTEPYDCIFGDNTPLTSHNYKTYAPILSMTTNDNFEDISIPNWDEWSNIQCINHNKYFPKPSVNKNSITNFCMNWDEKKYVAVFRGSSTGRGVDKHTNTRMKLCSIESDLLDVGITNWNNRPRIHKESNKLILSTFSKFGKNKSDFLTPKQQSFYKYIIHIDGHSSAFRLTLEMKMKSVLLIVDSDYYIWYKTQLKPYIHYIPIKKDLSDLLYQINWCKENDGKCKIISENCYKFYEENLQEQNIYEYLSNTINHLQLKKFETNRKPNYSGISKMLAKHYSKDSNMYDKITIPINIIEENKHITKYKLLSDDIFVKKKTTPHEAFVSIMCINEMYDTHPFTYSFCYKNNYLYMSNVNGITFQDWITNQFDISKYIIYLIDIINIIDSYQNSKYKLVHYDLSPWNIIIQGNKITIIDYEKSFCVYKNKEYGPYKFSTIIDVLSILIKSLNTIFQVNKRYRNISQIIGEEKEVFLQLGNFMSGTKYRKETFTNLYELKKFVNNMSKYDNLLFMEKYELDNETPKSFLDYLKH